VAKKDTSTNATVLGDGMKLVIGLHGPKGVGKNFVGDVIGSILENRGLTVKKLAFADEIKEFCINVLGLERYLVYGSDHHKNTFTQYEWDQMPRFVKDKFPTKTGYMTIREVLQIFGTEFIRECWDLHAWVKTVSRKIRNGREMCYIVTDVRFEDEFNCIKQMDGYNWFVSGPQRGDDFSKKDSHSSEKGLDISKFDFTINNQLTDTVETLRSQVEQWLSTINIGQPISETCSGKSI